MRTRDQLVTAAESGYGPFRMTRHEVLHEFGDDAVYSAYDFLYLAVYGRLTFHGRPVKLEDGIAGAADADATRTT
jgi:hypothetical protein